VPEDIRHPLFARVFDRLSRSMEPELGPRRDRLLSGLHGRVLEIGTGNGINFSHYPTSVEEVVALEPEPYMRAKAERAAAAATIRVTVQGGTAEELAFEEQSFDAAVACLVLCSVSSPKQVLSELGRVLRPGGELRFFEHVRSSRPGKARLQHLADRSGIWPRFGGGCHSGRDTPAMIEAAGFEIQDLDRFDIAPSWTITNPHVLGTATLPSP
jgi:ubiquinone/menaquinone biosynthesis C-methylase UbiE